MERDQLLVEIEEAIAETRDVVDRLERAYMILCAPTDRPTGRLIHLDRSRTLAELTEEVGRV